MQTHPDLQASISPDSESILKEMLGRAASASAQRAGQLAVEKQRREREALRLYEPSAYQNRYHTCKAKTCMMAGGTQVGKSLCGFVEIARAVTGQDPHGKYPKRGDAMCVGYKEDHIGLVIYQYLFMPGAFKIIKDSETGKWRTWKPWVKSDLDRANEAEDAPPLIPQRYIKKIVWQKAGQRVFDRVDFTTGWTLKARSSLGEPTQGIKLDLVHIDEDIERQDWYSEMLSRLTSRNGKLRWTALPHAKNDAIVNIMEMAEDDATKPNPENVVITATAYDNPYMPEEARESNIRAWKQEGEDVYRKRALGELTTDSSRVYPGFSRVLHDAGETSPTMSEARKVFIANHFQPPSDWTIAIAIDPGHTTCAAMFMAIPPPTLGVERFLFDEIYIMQSTAAMFADAMFRKTDGKTVQRFIIDAHGAAHSHASTGISVRQSYTDALIQRGVKCVDTGFHFINGVDNPSAREECARRWMAIREDTHEPTLFVVPEACPNFLREISRFKKKMTNGIVVDEANRRLPCHAVECMEYLVADNPKYVKPLTKQNLGRVQWILQGIREREERQAAMNRASGGSFINLGPSM